MISNKVSIGNYIDNLKFAFGNENLIFKNISGSQAMGNPLVNDIIFGLFKEDNTQLGESYCRADKYQGNAWYLDSIKVLPNFRGSGYGTQLLEKTCEALWYRTKADIVLEMPGNTISTSGFNRRCWYERHGFESHPDSSTTWMWRKFI